MTTDAAAAKPLPTRRDEFPVLRAITTRRYHSGKHAVEILVNGKPMGRTGLTLTVPAT